MLLTILLKSIVNTNTYTSWKSIGNTNTNKWNPNVCHTFTNTFSNTFSVCKVINRPLSNAAYAWRFWCILETLVLVWKHLDFLPDLVWPAYRKCISHCSTKHRLANRLLLRSNCILDALRCHCRVVYWQRRRQPHSIHVGPSSAVTANQLQASYQWRLQTTTFLISHFQSWWHSNGAVDFAHNGWQIVCTVLPSPDDPWNNCKHLWQCPHYM